MTQKPSTINDLVHLYYFEEKIQTIIDSEARDMKRLKYRPNYIATYADDTGTRRKITRATLVYRAGKKRVGKSSKTILFEESYDHAARIEDCLNSIAFAWFNHHEEYTP